MKLSERFIQAAQRLLPSPMTIAILLTGVTLLLALTLTSPPSPKLQISTENTLLTELSLDQPGTETLAVPDFPDSVRIKLTANQELIIKSKRNDELLYRQLFSLKPKEKQTSIKVKLSSRQVLKLEQKTSTTPYILNLLSYWEGGFFKFLTFAMQMMLILVLGHVLALTRPANWLIQSIVRHCNNTPKAAFIVTLATLLVAFFNWGLALVFGAILARKVGEHASKQQQPLNYPLIGAAGYSGLMVWHGGLSGSAPLKVAEQNHELVEQMGVIPISETLFSSMNLVCSLLLLLILPAAMFLLGRLLRSQSQPLALEIEQEGEAETRPAVKGAQRLDYANWLAWSIGLLMLLVGLYKTVIDPVFVKGIGFDWQFRFINPNFIIFILFGLAIILQGNLYNFKNAVGKAIGGSAGIMIQFPLYAGIMGIMISSGLVDVFSSFFVAIANETTYPLFTFLSSGLVNMFVPSGGGQWLVQGPIIIESSAALNVPLEKSIMAMCYGDQITNMLQPFWALPLLGITQLKAQDILPYTFFLLLVGTLIFCTILLLF